MKRLFKSLHLWLSLPAGVFIVILCLTGAVLVFQQEIQSIVNPSFYEVSGRDKPCRLVIRLNQLPIMPIHPELSVLVFLVKKEFTTLSIHIRQKLPVASNLWEDSSRLYEVCTDGCFWAVICEVLVA